MFYPKSCNRCQPRGDVMVDEYKNPEDDSYDLVCVQCGNRNFPEASKWVTLYMRLKARERVVPTT